MKKTLFLTILLSQLVLIFDAKADSSSFAPQKMSGVYISTDGCFNGFGRIKFSYNEQKKSFEGIYQNSDGNFYSFMIFKKINDGSETIANSCFDSGNIFRYTNTAAGTKIDLLIESLVRGPFCTPTNRVKYSWTESLELQGRDLVYVMPHGSDESAKVCVLTRVE